jgi:hypothetical protein
MTGMYKGCTSFLDFFAFKGCRMLWRISSVKIDTWCGVPGFAGQTEATTQGLIKALGQHVGKSMELRVKRRSSDSTVVLQVTASEASS